ncbi:hypothetical protein ScPMuIL_001956 [Solemya velum]
MKLTLKEVFVQSQTGMQCHPKLLKAIQNIYDAMEFEEFWAEFVHYLKYPMIVFKREPAVERNLDFVSKFIVSVGSKAETEVEEESTDDVEGNRLLQEMFNFLLQSHNATDRAVRFRCCQMINKLLSNLGENAQIDDDLYDRIYECMLERLSDKIPIVRLHAVLAIARLQDPTDENCPVIKSYLFLLCRDPNPEVRLTVLRSIAPSTKTLRVILERTRDVKDTVRREAYLVLGEKVHIKAMSIAFRVQLLQDGLSDRSEIVKAACSNKLLQTWLRTFGGNVLELLKCLDVENSTETCEITLQNLFEATSVDQLVENFDLLDENLLVPFDKLTCESSMYWQQVCKYIHSKGTEHEVYLEKVLPNCVQYTQYVQGFVDALKDCEDIEQRLEKEFIIQQLLLISSYMDIADQASKKALEKFLHNMLLAEHVPHSLMKFVIPRLCDSKNNSEAMVQYIAETISEIREPITTIEKGPTEEEKRKMDLKIASIRVKLNQLKEEMEESVRNQEFARAAELKASIAELDLERSEILDSRETEIEEIRTEKDDPITLLKCLTIVGQMVESLPLKSINSTLQMLLESQIVPGVSSTDPDVRNVAIHALGLCCYLSGDLAFQYLPLFMQVSQVDTEGVRITALQVIFDLLHIHGLDVSRSHNAPDAADPQNNSVGDAVMEVSSTGGDETETKDSANESSIENKASADRQNATAAKIVAILTSFLDKESPDLRTWLRKAWLKDDSHLRHCLGTFFPIYALANRNNQEVIEESFMPTLKTLMDAPSSSPLAEVNIGNVAEMLVQLTNSKLLVENQKRDSTMAENYGHDNIAVSVCNEIISCPDSFNLKLWVKILNQLQLSQDNTTALKDLVAMSDQMLQVVKEKPCLKSLEKFQSTLKKMYKEATGQAMESLKQPLTSRDSEKEEGPLDADETTTESHRVTLMPGPEADLTALDVSQHLMGDEEELDPEPLTLSKAVRTKSMVLTPTGRKPRSKLTNSAIKTRTLDLNESDLENSVFASPTPLRCSFADPSKSVLETTRQNLEDMMLQDDMMKNKEKIESPDKKDHAEGNSEEKKVIKPISQNNDENGAEDTKQKDKKKEKRTIKSTNKKEANGAEEDTAKETKKEKEKSKAASKRDDTTETTEINEKTRAGKKSEDKENNSKQNPTGRTRVSRRLKAAQEAK